MRLAGISIGQDGTLGWDLYDYGQLKLAATAKNSKGPIRASVYPWSVRPQRNQHGLLVRFSEPSPNDTITWAVQYAWPGLWRSLRAHGTSRGYLGSFPRSHRTRSHRRTRSRSPSVQPAARARIRPSGTKRGGRQAALDGRGRLGMDDQEPDRWNLRSR